MQNYKLGATEFYEKNKIEDLESLSGHSSTLLATYHFREFLKKILNSGDIETVSDCPCGDWNWMRTVKLDSVEYTGYDIVPEIIESNIKRFPKYKFEIFDAVEDILPKTDLIICKDLLTHLHDDVIKLVISNFKKSKSKYLLSTSYINGNISNMDVNWGFKELNLEKFGLKSLESAFENPKRFHGIYKLN